MNGMGGNDQHHNPHHNHAPGGSENGLGGSLGAPTIKNHSVTYFNDHLYCFGGYDGRRNHNLLLLYNIRDHRWIRPHAVQEDDFNSTRSNIDGDNNASVARVNRPESSNTSNNNIITRRRVVNFEVDDDDEESNADAAENENIEDNSDAHENDDDNDDSSESAQRTNQLQNVRNNHQQIPQQHPVAMDHDLYNRSNGHDLMNINPYAYTVTGTPPPGRNGHSATLATDEDDDDDDDEPRDNVTGRIIVLGGWLGQGPLAASDMHVLEISRGGRTLHWYQPAVKGTPPGPCNMHSADYVKARKEVFVFRGGNGTYFLADNL